MKPTDEQIREFWEQLGTKVVSFPHFLHSDKLVYDMESNGEEND